MQAGSSRRAALAPLPLTCNADHLLELKSDLTLIEGMRRYKAKVALGSVMNRDNNAAHDWAPISLPFFSVRHPIGVGYHLN
jgi:hypothetical protein